MLKNYFITAINNLLKNKLYSAINIIGLAVGLAACILITLYVRNELSYDKHWENADLISRINKGDSSKNVGSSTSMLLLPALIKYFPKDIEFATRIRKRSHEEEIQIGNMRYPASVPFVDKEFTEIFQFEELKGSLESTLKNPGNIALSEATSIKYFGDKDPIGEILTLILGSGSKEQYKVTAVYRNISPNTVLNLSAFSLFNESTMGAPYWFTNLVETYIRFNEKADIKKFVSRLPDFVDKTIPANNMMPLQPGQKMSDVRRYSLQKISDIYFNPLYKTHETPLKSGKTVVTVFVIISILVLIIACINYIILTTAKATQRSREVAMRKVVGARFKQLFLQFLGESILTTLIAFFFSIAIVELALPFFESIMNKELSVPYSSPVSYLFVILILTIVGLLGGLYPGLVLSSFSPTRALKANQTTETGGSNWFRNILVIFQFAASIVLIIATVVAYFQLLYMDKHDPGFNPENLLVVDNIDRKDISPYRNALQQELLKLPEVSNVGLSTVQPALAGGGMQMFAPFQRKTDNSMPNQEVSIKSMFVDYHFFSTYEISLLSGRYYTQGLDQVEPGPFSPNANEIKEKRVIINTEASRQLSYASAEEAIGGILVQGDTEYSIIGVVEDSQYRSLRTGPEPEMYHLIPSVAAFLSVKYTGDYQTAVEGVKRVWQEVVGDVTLRVGSVKQNLAATFDQEEKENRLLISFTLLTIFIACMGLFGMASFTVERRVKEIGLRKVMGAKVRDIVNFLGWNFLKPVLIANIIAWPVAILAMQNWLERFPFRFNPLLMIPICLGSGLIALAIAWATVASNTTHAARKNPIHSLRYE